jgi:uncharacterized repeat protein (TIGR01451 family)
LRQTTRPIWIGSLFSAMLATVVAPAAAGDPTLTKEVDRSYAQTAEALAYTITVANSAQASITTGMFTDSFPQEVAGCSWSCSVTGAGWCEFESGAGDIAQLVSIPMGTTATIEASCTFDPSPGHECATNVASFATMDPDTTAVDSAKTCDSAVTVFFDGFDTGTTEAWSAVVP